MAMPRIILHMVPNSGNTPTNPRKVGKLSLVGITVQMHDILDSYNIKAYRYIQTTIVPPGNVIVPGTQVMWNTSA